MTQDFPEEFGGHSDPFEIFNLWFDEAHETKLQNPNAFVLSTADSNGHPYSRVLLCKELRDGQFAFYSNYRSAKGEQLNANPLASMNFFWDPLHRQIKILGSVCKMTSEDSQNYWETRDRVSQLSQWASHQSKPLASRAAMEAEVKKMEKEFDGKPIPCPDHWGGYLLTPTLMEFWVGRSGRFHDRFCFTMVENQWRPQRLYP